MKVYFELINNNRLFVVILIVFKCKIFAFVATTKIDKFA